MVPCPGGPAQGHPSVAVPGERTTASGRLDHERGCRERPAHGARAHHCSCPGLLASVKCREASARAWISSRKGRYGSEAGGGGRCPGAALWRGPGGGDTRPEPRLPVRLVIPGGTGAAPPAPQGGLSVREGQVQHCTPRLGRSGKRWKVAGRRPPLELENGVGHQHPGVRSGRRRRSLRCVAAGRRSSTRRDGRRVDTEARKISSLQRVVRGRPRPSPAGAGVLVSGRDGPEPGRTPCQPRGGETARMPRARKPRGALVTNGASRKAGPGSGSPNQAVHAKHACECAARLEGSSVACPRQPATCACYHASARPRRAKGMCWPSCMVRKAVRGGVGFCSAIVGRPREHLSAGSVPVAAERPCRPRGQGLRIAPVGGARP